LRGRANSAESRLWVTRVVSAVARQLPVGLRHRTMSTPQRTGAVCHQQTKLITQESRRRIRDQQDREQRLIGAMEAFVDLA